LEQQHTTAIFGPVSGPGFVTLGNQAFNVGHMGRDVVIKGNFIDNAFFNFDKPSHGTRSQQLYQDRRVPVTSAFKLFLAVLRGTTMVVSGIGGIVLLGLAYLLGSLPTGYGVTKALKGIDIRQHGSGNTGATNVFRVVGKPAGIAVLVIDLLKGVAAVLLMKTLFPLVSPAWGAPPIVSWWLMLAGIAAIVGHSRSVWLNWTGGKSAATGLGVLLAMAWPVGLTVAGVFLGVLALFRIVSLGSILAAMSAVVMMMLLQQPLPYILMAIAGSLYVILRHRSNIERLLAGTEPQLGR
jgi:glycerol-3-phosphate acyltransferase PlsY